MIVRHETLWAIAVLVLLASVSFSESVKLRKPRKRTTTRTPYQQSRIGPVIIRVMRKYTDDGFTRGASNDCTNGNCRDAHDKFNFDVNKAISEENNFLSDVESLRYVVHPEKYEHFVLRKNTGHNRYKRDFTFITFIELPSSNTSDHTVIDRGGDASEVKNVNKGNFTRVPLYRIDRYRRDFSKLLSERSRTRRDLAVDNFSRRNNSDYYASEVTKNVNKGNFTRVPLYRIDRYRRDFSKLLSERSRMRRGLAVDNFSRRNNSDYYASEVTKNVNKGNFTRVPLYRIDRYTRDFSKPLSETSRTRRSLAVDYFSRRNNSDYYASEVTKNANKGNFTRVPLYRIDRYTRNFSKSLSETSRTKRNLAVDYFSRRNDSDYYAQRKAVMERYYARQREINARYANRTNFIPRLEHNDVSQHRPATSNVTLFNLGRVYPSKDSSANSATFRYPSTKIDPIYSNESRYNEISTELDNRRNAIPESDLGFKSDADLSQTRSSDNIERNGLALDFITPTPCTNLSSSGTLAPKTRLKHVKNETDQNNEDCDDSTNNVR